MEQKLLDICTHVADSRDVLIKKMNWEMESNLSAIMCAFIYASKGKDVDVDRYVECKKILKKEVSVFSEFRGIAGTMIITKMALSDNPEEYLKGALTVYKKLREIHKLTASPYMVLAAINIYEKGGVEQSDELIEKLETLYASMNRKHAILISDKDRGFLSVLATSGMNSDSILEETENCYKLLSKLSVINKDGVHSMSQILSMFPGNSEEKAEKVKETMQALKNVKCPVSKQYGFPGLGALSMIKKSSDEIAADVADAESFFKNRKGFKWYNTGGREFRRIYAQLAVSLRYLPDSMDGIGTQILGSITVALIEEIIMLIILMEMQAISSSSNSSSGS